jgi:long-chain acyl-CoA synthetase
MSASTLPGLLLERATGAAASHVAVRSHGRGIWAPTTWSELAVLAERIGRGLSTLGVTAGSTVLLLGENRVEWIAADLAIQGLGAATLALDPNESESAVVAALRSSPVAVAIVGDEEQFDKVVAAEFERPIVVIESRGLRHLDADSRVDADRLLTLAQVQQRSGGTDWRAAAHALDPGAVALTYRVSDGVRSLDHREVLASGDRVKQSVGLHARDALFPQTSFANPVERALSITGMLTTGLAIALGPDPRLRALEMTAAQPTLVHGSSAWADRFAADLQRRVGATKGLKKLALARGFRLRPPQNTPADPGLSPLKMIGAVAIAAVFVMFGVTTGMNDWVRLLIAAGIGFAACLIAVFSGLSATVPLRRRLGLQRARALVVASPLSATTAEVFGALGVPVVSVDPDSGSPGSGRHESGFLR